MVTAAGSKLGKSHQLWMMNEVNKLIWPSPAGVGMIDQAAWDRTVEIATKTQNLEEATVLTAAPAADAFTNTYAEAADKALEAEGLNVTGDAFKPVDVTLNEGGQ